MIYQEIGEIQKNLPSYGVDEKTPLNKIMVAVKEECYKHQLTCWFTITEDSVILKVKSWNQEYGAITSQIPINETNYEELKLEVLRNTFLIYKTGTPEDVTETIKMDEDNTPKAIEKIKEILEDKGLPTTRRNIAVELGKHDLPSTAMNNVREYLKQFSAEEII